MKNTCYAGLYVTNKMMATCPRNTLFRSLRREDVYYPIYMVCVCVCVCYTFIWFIQIKDVKNHIV